MIELNSDRILLTPFLIDDIEAAHTVFTDSYVRKYLWDDEVIDLSIVEDILKLNVRTFEEERWGIWKVIRKSDDAFIGFAGLWIFFNEPLPKLIVGLFENNTKMGYATESAKLVIEYSFRELGFDSLTAAMDSPNSNSIRLVKNLGMKFKQSKIIDHAPTLFYKLENNL